MIESQVHTKDFGRVIEIHLTKKVAGQYHYGRIAADGVIEWVRHCHEEEVKPLVVCNKDTARIITKSLLLTLGDENG